MTHRIRILVLGTALALSLAVAPAQAWPAVGPGDSQAASWWDVVVDFLAPLFGLARSEGSCSIDPDGCPPPPSTLQNDGSCEIDPNGTPVCRPHS